MNLSFLCAGEEYIINSSVKVIPTPGHTLSDVTVLVDSKGEGVVAITGNNEIYINTCPILNSILKPQKLAA